MKSFEVSVKINHNKAHAWEYYFNQTNSWWSSEYYSSPRTKRFTIDTYIGGKCYEHFGEEGGLVWGEIIGVDYTNWLLIRGNLTRDFGGPAITFEKYTFIEDADGHTTVTYSIDFVGDIKASGVASLKKGWEEILKVHFKEYCKKH